MTIDDALVIIGGARLRMRDRLTNIGKREKKGRTESGVGMIRGRQWKEGGVTVRIILKGNFGRIEVRDLETWRK